MTLHNVITAPGICWGGCGLSERRHERGVIFLDVVHFADRRFTKRGARNLLMLLARREREADPGFLNDPIYDFLYPALDALRAQELAGEAGFRLPARLFDREREQARALAERRHVSIRRYPKLRSWLRR
jgi:hypothetical protein